MSEQPIEFVKVYDFATQQVTSMPAAELAPGMVQIRLEGSDEVLWADSSQLQQGGYQHEPFDGELQEKIHAIQQSLSEVFPRSFEEWEDGFRRDRNVWQEVDLWLHVCYCLQWFTEHHSPSFEERREAFRVLIACLNGTPTTVFETVTLQLLDPLVARRLADVYFGTDTD